MCITTSKVLDKFWVADASEPSSCTACEGASLCRGGSRNEEKKG